MLALYAVLAVTPCAVLWGCGAALDRWVHSFGRTRAPDSRGLDRLLRDLGRLRRDAARIESSRDLPGRVGRLRSIAAAYDEVLRECARLLGLPVPGAGGAVGRLQLEAQLSARGLVW